LVSGNKNAILSRAPGARGTPVLQAASATSNGADRSTARRFMLEFE
jgi:hypothetical protein